MNWLSLGVAVDLHDAVGVGGEVQVLLFLLDLRKVSLVLTTAEHRMLQLGHLGATSDQQTENTAVSYVLVCTWYNE